MLQPMELQKILPMQLGKQLITKVFARAGLLYAGCGTANGGADILDE